MPYYRLEYGRIGIAADGKNNWSEVGTAASHLVEAESYEKVQGLINQLIMHQPKK
jgi:hypothetical protein